MTVLDPPMPTTSNGIDLFRVIEVWSVEATPAENTGSAASRRLVRTSAIHRDAPAIEAASESMAVDDGSGLPGQVAAEGVPVVFPDLQASAFLRSEAAASDGLSAGVGLPVYRDGELTAVVLMLFTSSSDAVGAIESWLPDRDRNELTLGTSHYMGLERFEMISKYVQFPYGSGLPGEVKQTAEPKLLTGISRSKAFIRAAGAEAEGLSIAMGWPVITYGDDLKAVFVLLSSSQTPLARLFQVWQEETPPEKDGISGSPRLVPKRLAAEDCRPLAEATAAKLPTKGVGLLGRVWESGQPLATTDFSEEPDDVRELAELHGVYGAIAIPVFRGTELKGVVALWG